MSKADYPQLRQFFGAYFHQDWDIDAEDADGVVALYVSDDRHTDEQLRAIARQIDEYLENEGSQENISQGLFEKLGCEYLPASSGSNAGEWLTHVANLLRRAIESRRNNLLRS